MLDLMSFITVNVLILSKSVCRSSSCFPPACAAVADTPLWNGFLGGNQLASYQFHTWLSFSLFQILDPEITVCYWEHWFPDWTSPSPLRLSNSEEKDSRTIGALFCTFYTLEAAHMLLLKWCCLTSRQWRWWVWEVQDRKWADRLPPTHLETLLTLI